MDEIERRLKEDAAVDATVDAGLRRRIDAAWQSTQPARSRQAAGRRPFLAWASVATAVAAAALFFMLPERNPPGTLPVSVVTTGRPPPIALDVSTVELTQPLQQELTALQADARLARDAIERELRRSF